MIERVPTGIPGFDELLKGGIPKRNVVLLSGGPGTGKTIFSQQFLWNGLSQFEENGIYVALEEHPKQIIENMKQFGWDVTPYDVSLSRGEYISSKRPIFALVDAFTGGYGGYAQKERYVINDPTDEHLFVEVLTEAIKEIDADRVVVDSVTSLYITRPAVARRIILLLKKALSGLGCTSILVSQISVGERGFGGPGVEHATDGIVRLDLDEINGELKRSLIIWKMRGTSHSMKRHPFEITDKGIVVYPDKVVKRRGAWYYIE